MPFTHPKHQDLTDLLTSPPQYSHISIHGAPATGKTTTTQLALKNSGSQWVWMHCPKMLSDRVAWRSVERGLRGWEKREEDQEEERKQ